MRFLKVYASSKLSSSVYESLSRSLRSIIAWSLGKSENFITVIFRHTIFQSFGTDPAKPSVYIEFKKVDDLSPEKTNRLSAIIFELLTKFIDLDPLRMYVGFQPTERHL